VTARGFRLVAVSVVLGGAALLLSGCSYETVFGLGWPTGITPEGKLNRDLWVWSVIASLIVGVIVWALLFWTSVFHRKKKTDTELPRQFGYNMPLELVLTVIPFLIISVLFYFPTQTSSST
jgi:cytochrome c oxidase subunit II